MADARYTALWTQVATFTGLRADQLPSQAVKDAILWDAAQYYAERHSRGWSWLRQRRKLYGQTASVVIDSNFDGGVLPRMHGLWTVRTKPIGTAREIAIHRALGTTNLVSYWQMQQADEDTVRDEVGSNPLTLVGDPLWTPLEDGDYYGIETTALGDYLEKTSAAGLPAEDSSRTIRTQVAVGSKGDDAHYLVTLMEEATEKNVLTLGYSFFGDETSRETTILVYPNYAAAASALGHYYYWRIPYSFPAGTLLDLFLVYTAADGEETPATFRLSINGGLLEAATGSVGTPGTALDGTPDRILIGRGPDDAAPGRSVLDVHRHVAIWDAALTQATIEAYAEDFLFAGRGESIDFEEYDRVSKSYWFDREEDTGRENQDRWTVEYDGSDIRIETFPEPHKARSLGYDVLYLEALPKIDGTSNPDAVFKWPERRDIRLARRVAAVIAGMRGDMTRASEHWNEFRRGTTADLMAEGVPFADIHFPTTQIIRTMEELQKEVSR